MGNLFKAMFLFSSFGPLYAIFAVRLHYSAKVAPIWPQAFWLAFGLSIITFLLSARLLSGVKRALRKVIDVKPKDAEVLSYLMTYIPTLVFRDFADPGTYIPLVILYGIIAVLYMRLDAPYLNPFFLLFNYRIYEAKLEDSRAVITIVSKGRPVGGSEKLLLAEIGAGTLYYCE